MKFDNWNCSRRQRGLHTYRYNTTRIVGSAIRDTRSRCSLWWDEWKQCTSNVSYAHWNGPYRCARINTLPSAAYPIDWMPSKWCWSDDSPRTEWGEKTHAISMGLVWKWMLWHYRVLVHEKYFHARSRFVGHFVDVQFHSCYHIHYFGTILSFSSLNSIRRRRESIFFTFFGFSMGDDGVFCSR